MEMGESSSTNGAQDQGGRRKRALDMVDPDTQEEIVDPKKPRITLRSKYSNTYSHHQ
jgi:hypothetical protein